MYRTAFLQLPQALTMATHPQRQEGQDDALSTLDVAIETLNLAKEISSITPARAVFGSVGVILTTIRVSFFLFYETMSSRPAFEQGSMVNQQDYIEVGLSCAEICGVLDRGTKRKRTEDLSQSVHGAINQLTTSVEPAVHSLDD